MMGNKVVRELWNDEERSGRRVGGMKEVEVVGELVG